MNSRHPVRRDIYQGSPTPGGWRALLRLSVISTILIGAACLADAVRR